jgi:hypothetical protein
LSNLFAYSPTFAHDPLITGDEEGIENEKTHQKVDGSSS